MNIQVPLLLVGITATAGVGVGTIAVNSGAISIEDLSLLTAGTSVSQQVPVDVIAPVNAKHTVAPTATNPGAAAPSGTVAQPHTSGSTAATNSGTTSASTAPSQSTGSPSSPSTGGGSTSTGPTNGTSSGSTSGGSTSSGGSSSSHSNDDGDREENDDEGDD